jgi:uncharacterized protein (TIGR04255 family)
MFSNEKRCIYHKNQLADVICQLRFPEILSIETNLPAQFQDAIRDTFPQYSAKKEVAAPKLEGVPGNLSVVNQPATVNYQFVSQDGTWRVNLTSKFISLTCSKYTCWEEFAKQLDKPLAAFIQIYKPAYFERVGLRYLNFISKNALSLQNVPFSELFQPQYLGILGDEEIREDQTTRSGVDAEFTIRGGCRAKIHAGPGLVKRNGRAETEIKFIFDQDLYMSGNVPVNYSAGTLEILHSQAFSIFRDAITDTLHEALDPAEI